MVVDGKKVQQDIKERLSKETNNRGISPRLDLVYAGNNAVTETFMRLKKDFGESIGATVVMHTYEASSGQERIIKTLQTLSSADEVDGIVVQLPLPDDFDEDAVLNAIPKEKDVDLLSDAKWDEFKNNESSILPPVVGAIKEVFDRYDVALEGKEVSVVGHGKLVGKPVAVWLENQGYNPHVFEKGDDLSQLKDADIVISGAGDPHIITPEMVKKGAVLIDAGTSDTDDPPSHKASEGQGGVKGDIDPACEKKARLFSSVPGGIGPITVAKLFENLLICAQ